MKIRSISLILCLFLLLSVAFTACGGGETGTVDNPDVIERTTEEADPNDVYDDEIRDLKGHEFLFITQEVTASHLKPNEIASESLTGDKVNDAVFKRNSALQKDYNCTIAEERTDNVLNVTFD